MSEKERQPTHIAEMLIHLGVEPGCAAISRWALSFTTAFHRCENCATKEACIEWLAANPASTFAPSFCPNADIIFEMQADQPGIGGKPVTLPKESPAETSSPLESPSPQRTKARPPVRR
jgi:hypothetical protein